MVRVLFASFGHYIYLLS